ncbi:MAG: hypothetical protein NXI20_01980 [bacterium]|nr:hypothetical protein [bacterium]
MSKDANKIKLQVEQQHVKMTWRKRFSILTYLTYSIPLGITVIMVASLFGWKDPIPLPVISMLLAFAVLLGIFDYFNRFSSIVINKEKFVAKHGVIQIPNTTCYNIPTKNINKASVKSREEHSGDTEGPNVVGVYWDVYLELKDKQKFRITKGLQKPDANFVARKITSHKDKLLQS